MQIKGGNNESGKKGAEDTKVPPLPPVNFSTFILSLNSSALVHLGELPMPGGDTCNKDLNLARHSIDVLAMLQEKTKGNLTEEEEKLLQHILYDLRMKFVNASQ